MADVTASSPGQNLLTGDRGALFKFEYQTDVIAAFETKNVTLNRFMKRQTVGAKGVKFPTSGFATAQFHTPGTQLIGASQMPVGEKTINIDGTLLSDTFVDELEDLMSYWDYRGQVAQKQGYALAKQMDQTLLRLAVLCARAPANIPGQTPAGTTITDAAMKTDGVALAKALFAADNQFDMNGVDDDDRVAYLSPAQQALLVLSKDTINKLWGGEGSYADGSIARVGGVEIVKTTHLPTLVMVTDADVTAAGFNPATVLTKYRGDFSKTAGVVTHKSAIGTALAMDIATSASWQELFQAYLLIAKMAYGSDILRPESAIELATT